MPEAVTGLRDRLRRGAEERLGVDIRALAALRVALGALLLADLAVRARHFRAFYTDDGALPRDALASVYPEFVTVSLHASGSATVNALLFVVAAVFAAAVAVGYRTRLALLVSFVLLVSLHARNPFVLNSGDVLLRTFVLLGIFLPLGARWGIDSVRRGHNDAPRSGHVFSVASAAVLVYVVTVYTTNAVFKLRGDMWLGGDAAAYALNIDRYTVRLGPHLADSPELLTVVSWLWLGMVVGSVGLVALVGWWRVGFVAAFVGAHLGMALTLRLGLFPFVSIAVLLPFLPPRFWDRVESRVPDRLDGVGGRLTATSEPVTSAETRRIAQYLGTGFVAVFLVVTVLWQGAALGYVSAPEAVEDAAEPRDHTWAMFAPDPSASDGWYVVRAETEGGDVFDALNGGAVEDGVPPDTAVTYPTTLWHRYLSNTRGTVDSGYLGDYLCRTAGDDIESISVYYFERPVSTEGTGDADKRQLADTSCGAP